MSRILYISLAVLTLLFGRNSLADDDRSLVGFGLAAGGSRGQNFGGREQWSPQGRAFMQFSIMPEIMNTRIGVGYARLRATGNYAVETALADARLQLSPTRIGSTRPYLFTGVGFSKMLKSGEDALPMIPLGAGTGIKIGNSTTLDLEVSYALSLSDRLDGKSRAKNDLNVITNDKNDAFVGFTMGFTFGGGGRSPERLDVDADGLLDDDEVKIGTNPKIPDTDDDGLMDGSEINKYHSNPLKADSDDDGLKEGAEVNQYKTDPLDRDSDKDNLNDGEEVLRYTSDPNKIDTDADGLDDAAEANQYKTSPIKADTDGDGLADGLEINQYKTDPNKMDSDADDLVDGEEVSKYKTDPYKSDSDSDGLTDGAEVIRLHIDPNAADSDLDGLPDGKEVNTLKTDPNRADTDGDGLNEKDEVEFYHTNALKIDSDDGGMNDGAEIQKQTDPLDPKDDVMFSFKKGQTLVLHSISFEFDKAVILKSCEEILEKVYVGLLQSPELSVTITGHTDNVGNDEYNLKLSDRRAAAVREWLIKRGIDASRLESFGKGEGNPMATNDTQEGRSMNRRVEFYAYQTQENPERTSAR